jgi:hypothetical protein
VTPTVAIPSALRPLWHHFIENDPEDRLSDLRSVREELYKSGDRIQDISPALTATGNLPYLDVGTEHTVELGTVACVTESAGLVIVCNVLSELRARKIVDMNPFTSTEIDEDDGPLREGPWEEFIRSGDGIFPDVVGDYVRYAEESFPRFSPHLFQGMNVGKTNIRLLRSAGQPQFRFTIQRQEKLAGVSRSISTNVCRRFSRSIHGIVNFQLTGSC